MEAVQPEGPTKQGRGAGEPDGIVADALWGGGGGGGGGGGARCDAGGPDVRRAGVGLAMEDLGGGVEGGALGDGVDGGDTVGRQLHGRAKVGQLDHVDPVDGRVEQVLRLDIAARRDEAPGGIIRHRASAHRRAGKVTGAVGGRSGGGWFGRSAYPWHMRFSCSQHSARSTCIIACWA